MVMVWSAKIRHYFQILADNGKNSLIIHEIYLIILRFSEP